MMSALVGGGSHVNFIQQIRFRGGQGKEGVKGCQSPGIVGTAETGNLGIRFLIATRVGNLNFKLQPHQI